MKIKKNELSKLRTQILVVFVAHIISFLFAMPILWLEQQVEGSSIQTLSDSLYFMFVSVATIGYGDLTLHHEMSKALLVVAFVITRASFLVAILSASFGVVGKRKAHEMSVEDRLLVMENELKQLRGVIYNVNKLLECEVKHIKAIERKFDGR